MKHGRQESRVLFPGREDRVSPLPNTPARPRPSSPDQGVLFERSGTGSDLAGNSLICSWPSKTPLCPEPGTGTLTTRESLGRGDSGRAQLVSGVGKGLLLISPCVGGAQGRPAGACSPARPVPTRSDPGVPAQGAALPSPKKTDTQRRRMQRRLDNGSNRMARWLRSGPGRARCCVADLTGATTDTL